MSRLLVLGIGLVCSASAFAGDDFANSRRVNAGRTLRVLSYNIHHGEGVDESLDLERIARVIRSVEPDLVALQEVDKGTERTNRIDQPGELSRLCGMQVVFERNIEFQGGEYGNAVLSKLPIVSHENHLLPLFDEGEQRGVLEVRVDGGEGLGVVRFLSTHLDHRSGDEERLASARLINEITDRHAHLPTILAGDLNAPFDGVVLDCFRERWRVSNAEPAPTVPVGEPRRQIDFVLYRPEHRWESRETRVLDEAIASDHRAILAVLELKLAPFPRAVSDWHGFDRYDFEVDGKGVVVVVPEDAAAGRPWAWHGEFFGHKPEPDVELLKAGFHIVYLRVPDMLGSPRAVGHWNACYRAMTEEHGLASKVALVGLSRGGLYCYNWAIANPDKTACIYADAAVCDFKSWPGGMGAGVGSPRDWELVMEQWGFASEADAHAYGGNPVDNLRPLAEAGVPLLHVFGDADDVVPWEENTGLVAERYEQFGGRIDLIRKPGVKHHPHGLDDPGPIVEFIRRHATPPPGSREVSIESASVRNEDGVLVHSIDSVHQSQATEVRVLLPDEMIEGERSSVLFVLPVEAGRKSRWGDGLAEVQRANLHNEHGVICVSPTFSDLPWYADHPDDPRVAQESYLINDVLALLRWEYPQARHDRDGRLLLGFSKSGWGAWSLLLRHPEMFGRAAAWDAPLMLDAPGKYGSGPIFGGSENFERYRVSTLVRERGGELGEAPRLIHLGYGNFRQAHQEMEALLLSVDVPHVYRDGPERRHHWDSGWMPEAVGELMLRRPD